jgi:hypothetical protein
MLEMPDRYALAAADQAPLVHGELGEARSVDGVP